MAGTNFILCKQDVTYLQIVSELERIFKTSFMLYFASIQSTLLSAFCKELKGLQDCLDVLPTHTCLWKFLQNRVIP